MLCPAESAATRAVAVREPAAAGPRSQERDPPRLPFMHIPGHERGLVPAGPLAAPGFFQAVDLLTDEGVEVDQALPGQAAGARLMLGQGAFDARQRHQVLLALAKQRIEDQVIGERRKPGRAHPSVFLGPATALDVEVALMHLPYSASLVQEHLVIGPADDALPFGRKIGAAAACRGRGIGLHEMPPEL